jgi:parallel beta-helix repeat protein
MNNLNYVTRSLLFVIAILVLFATTIVPTSAKDLTVGSQGQYKTIQQAVNAANAGDIIRVAPGTYTENVVVSKSLTIIAASGRPTVTAATSSQDVITVTGPGVRIEGLTITGGVNGVHIHNTSKCTVVNVVAKNNVRAGVYLAQSTNNVISNCNLANNGYGVYADHASNNQIAFNIATGEVGAGDELGDGIYLYYCNNNTIKRNTLSSNIDFGLSLYHSARNVITNNTINDNMAIGIRLGEGSNYNTLTYNTFTRNGANNQDTGIWGEYHVGIVRVSTTGNRIYLNNFVSQQQATAGEANDATLNSTEKLVYTFNGVEHTGYMGNYYSDYNGTDKDGTGIGSTPSSYGDKYPLIKPVANYGTITPVSAVKTTTSTPHGQNESTKAVAGNQSVSGSLLPGFEFASTVAGLVIALLVLFAQKYRTR